jgi:integrase
LRIGELLALRRQDVDLQDGFLSVRQTVYEGHFDEPESKRSKRRIPLGPTCVEILASLKHTEAAPSALVFSARNGSPLSRRNLLNRQLKPACKALGLTGANWHWLRHAHTTLLDVLGTPHGTLQALPGHSTPEITRETYIHSVPADAR